MSKKCKLSKSDVSQLCLDEIRDFERDQTIKMKSEFWRDCFILKPRRRAYHKEIKAEIKKRGCGIKPSLTPGDMEKCKTPQDVADKFWGALN